MNESEHLLTCLAEEAGEVVQATCKCLRFGCTDGYPGTGRTNIHDLVTELVQLQAVVELLEDRRVLPLLTSLEHVKQLKKVKVMEYMTYARERGTLEPKPSVCS